MPTAARVAMATTPTSATSSDGRSAASPRTLSALNRRLRRRSGGFTLIEVIVVMVLVGVVAALVAPTIRGGIRQSAVRRSVRAFISAARQASAVAVNKRRPTSLIVWPNDGTFGVEGSSQRYELPDFAEFGEIQGGREAEADDEVRFDFYPTGSSSGGSVEIDFDPGDHRQAYLLILDPLIGRVRIETDS